MVDEVEEVLTVSTRPARGGPDRQRRLDRGDRQDRRPPGHPAQPRGPVRPRRSPTSSPRPSPHDPAPSADPQRVVVADDSRLMRRMLADALDRQGFDVVGTAARRRRGARAVPPAPARRPHARPRDARPRRPRRAARAARRPGRAGARRRRLRLLPRPRRPRRRRARRGRLRPRRQARRSARRSTIFAAELGRKVAPRPRSRPRPARRGRAPSPRAARPAAARRAAGRRASALVVIACSTGGPRALGELLPALPVAARRRHADRPAHAARLHRLARRRASTRARRSRVREAAGGESLDPGRRCSRPAASTCASAATAAPGSPTTPPRAACARAPTSRSPTPRACSARALLLVVLTGMGRDGLEGARAVSAAGGRVLVEAESTCAVYGMPRAVAEAGLADPSCRSTELAARDRRRRPALTARCPPRRCRDELPSLLRGGPPALRRRPAAVQARPDGAPRRSSPAPRRTEPAVYRACCAATATSSTPSWTA